MKEIQRMSAGAAAVAALALALTGCAQGVADGDKDPTEFGPDATIDAAQLQVMGFSEPDEIGSTRWALAEKQISPATIKYADGGFDIQAFLAANSANNSPDLIYVKREMVSSLAGLGAIMPLEGCIAGEGIATADFNQSALAEVIFNGNTYGIPEFNQVQITMANSKLLAEQGLTTADVDGSDWDKLKDATGKLAKLDGGSLKTIGYDPKIPEFLPLWAKANGADLISADGRTAQLDTPEVVEALTYAASLLEPSDGWAKVKSLRDSADFFGEGNQYATDALGAMNMEQWYVNVLAETTPDAPLAIVPFVSRATGKPVAMATGSAWAIPTKAKNKAAACRFISTMVDTESWMAAAKVRVDAHTAAGKVFTGLLTGNTVADQKIRDTYVVPTGDKTWDDAIDAIYAANDNLFNIAPNPAGQEFREAWLGAANRVLAGEMTPQESLTKAQADAQKALDAAWAKLEG